MTDKKPKILVTGRLPEFILNRLGEKCDVESNQFDRPMEDAVLRRSIADKEGLISMITDSVDSDLMDRAPRLRVISQMAVGFNNIDVKAATAGAYPLPIPRGSSRTRPPSLPSRCFWRSPGASSKGIKWSGRAGSSTGRLSCSWARRSRGKPWA